MTEHTEGKTGAWLVLESSQQLSSTTHFGDAPCPSLHERELTPAECLALAAVVVAWRPTADGGLRERLAEAFAAPELSGGVVAQWLARWPRAEQQPAAGAAAARSLLDQLGRELRVAAVPEPRCVEAELLVAALRLVREHAGLRQEFDERLAEARLEAVRQLAYGAGHEINNPLANIATRGQSLLRDETDPERRRKLATVVDQAFRARDMIGGLMVFAKPPVAALARVELGGLVEAVLGALGSLPVAEGVEVRSIVPPGPVWAHIDPHLVAEALQAVVVNAMEAVAAGGSIRVRVIPGSSNGFHAVAVDDNGPGMDASEQAVAFDPFHCGREAGRGLGVGLSKAWSLARACGGRLMLGDAEAGGAAVRLELPAASSLPADAEGPVS